VNFEEVPDGNKRLLNELLNPLPFFDYNNLRFDYICLVMSHHLYWNRTEEFFKGICPGL